MLENGNKVQGKFTLHLKDTTDHRLKVEKSYKGAHKVHLQKRVENAHEINAKLAKSWHTLPQIYKEQRAAAQKAAYLEKRAAKKAKREG